MNRTETLALNADDVALLVEALDSHEYWQLGDVLPRNNGYVWLPGDCVDAEDRFWAGREPAPEVAEAIVAVRRTRALSERLAALVRS